MHAHDHDHREKGEGIMDYKEESQLQKRFDALAADQARRREELRSMDIRQLLAELVIHIEQHGIERS